MVVGEAEAQTLEQVSCAPLQTRGGAGEGTCPYTIRVVEGAINVEAPSGIEPELPV